MKTGNGVCYCGLLIFAHAEPELHFLLLVYVSFRSFGFPLPEGPLTHGPLSLGMISATLTLQMHTHAHIEALSVTASLFTHWNTVYIYCFFTMRHFVRDKDLLLRPSASSPSSQACTVAPGCSPPVCQVSAASGNTLIRVEFIPGCMLLLVKNCLKSFLLPRWNQRCVPALRMI